MDAGSQETPSDDFGFAFNQVRFSDSVLRIEIVSDCCGSRAEWDDSVVDWIHNRKHRRDDQITNSDETVKRYKENSTNRSVSYENQEEGATAEESPENLENAPDHAYVSEAGDGTAKEPETSPSTDCSVLQVKTIYVSPPILAAKSPFFYKLFSNVTRDLEQRHVTLRIHASEEDALMDLLNFIYCTTLHSTTPTALLKVLMAADKFEVASCMRYCSQLLLNLPMSCESALLFLNLPSMLGMVDMVQPLADAAKKFLAGRFKDIDKCQEELLNLPLLGLEVVLSSDNLQVASEDVLFSLVLKWAQKHYPKQQDRREILSTRLIPCIRFPYMSCHALKRVLLQCDIESSLSLKAILEALFYKAASPNNDRSLGSSNPSEPRLAERAYKLRPMKVVELETPRQQRFCYLDLKREECARLFPLSSFCSVGFDMGGHEFYLSGQCCEENSLRVFGLFLGMRGNKEGSASLTVDYEFASRAKPSEDFVSRFKAKTAFTGGTSKGRINLFGAPWNVFIADDSPHFIDGVLHLRVDLKLTKLG